MTDTNGIQTVAPLPVRWNQRTRRGYSRRGRTAPASYTTLLYDNIKCLLHRQVETLGFIWQ